MSDKPRDLSLELMLTKMTAELVAIRTELTGLNGTVRELAGVQVLLGNRVESAFSRALRMTAAAADG